MNPSTHLQKTLQKSSEDDIDISSTSRHVAVGKPEAKIVSLDALEQLAIAKGEVAARSLPSELDALGLEGKDCPCAPR